MTGTAFRTQKIFFALGTVCTLTAYDGEALHALERAKARVMQIHNKMNAYDENSEISAVNRSAGVRPVRVSYDTMRLIEESLAFSAFTGGSFDITTRPISSLWKMAIKVRTVPAADVIRSTASLTNYRDVIIDRTRSTVMLRRRGQQIDLGAIAKGYAANEVRRILRAENVTQAIISLGGTVINMGQTRRVGIRDPFKKTGDHFSFIDVGEKAVVSSGVYEQSFVKDDVIYHHIIDPLTGYPSDTPLAGVTLIGDNAAQLDALCTAACAMPLPQAIAMLKRCGTPAIFVTKFGEVFTSDGVKCEMEIERSRAA